MFLPLSPPFSRPMGASLPPLIFFLPPLKFFYASAKINPAHDTVTLIDLNFEFLGQKMNKIWTFYCIFSYEIWVKNRQFLPFFFLWFLGKTGQNFPHKSYTFWHRNSKSKSQINYWNSFRKILKKNNTKKLSRARCFFVQAILQKFTGL